MIKGVANIVSPIPNQSRMFESFTKITITGILIHVLIKIVHTLDYTSSCTYLKKTTNKQKKNPAKTYTKIVVLRFEIVLLSLFLMIQYFPRFIQSVLSMLHSRTCMVLACTHFTHVIYFYL